MGEKMKYADLRNTLDGFIKAAETETKKADEAGPSAQPIANAPDGTTAATEGERSSENAEYVKEHVTAESVDDKGNLDGDSTSGGEIVPTHDGDEKSTDITPKSDKDDPGTAHPSGAQEKQSAEKDAAARVLAKAAVLSTVKAAEGKDEKPEDDKKKEEDEKPEVKKEDAAASTAEGDKVEDKPDERREMNAEEKKAYAEGQQLAKQAVDVIKGNANEISQKVVGNIEKEAKAAADMFCDFIEGHKLGEMAKKAGVPPEVIAALLEGGGEEAGGEVLEEDAVAEGEPEAIDDKAVEGSEELAEENGEEELSPEEIAAAEELAASLAGSGVSPEMLMGANDEALAGRGIEDKMANHKVVTAEKDPIKKMAKALALTTKLVTKNAKKKE